MPISPASLLLRVHGTVSEQCQQDGYGAACRQGASSAHPDSLYSSVRLGVRVWVWSLLWLPLGIGTMGVSWTPSDPPTSRLVRQPQT
jgi:hypothetical protein